MRDQGLALAGRGGRKRFPCTAIAQLETLKRAADLLHGIIVALAFMPAKGVKIITGGGSAETGDGFRQRRECRFDGGWVAQPDNNAPKPMAAATNRIEETFNIAKG